MIEGIVPSHSLGILIGDSGLGKSPLVYQMALCISSGKPFLGRAVKQGSVLVLDFENGLGDVDTMLDSLCLHIGLSSAPKELHLWNINDSSSNYGQVGHSVYDMIRDIKPSLVILDSLTGLYPDIEKANSNVTTAYKFFRNLMKETGASILSLHHIKKPSDKPEFAPPPLEGDNFKQWFLQARGPRALINGSDIRIGVDIPHSANILTRSDGKPNEELALAFRGFGRVRGEIPLQYLARVNDEEGQPLGYRVVTGASLLFNRDQEEVLAKLPQQFRFKDAKEAYNRGDQATTDFLKKCQGMGLIRKVGKAYEKVRGAE